MFLLLSFLQIIGDDLIRDSALSAIDTTNNAPTLLSNGYVISLVTLLIINVLVMVLNFVLDLIRHKHDNHNFKVHIIATKGVEVESQVYSSFQKMAALQSGDEHELLESILKLDSFLNQNRLYIEKKYLAHTNEFLDYFKSIQHKMTTKNIKKEESFFDKLTKSFYGE